MDGVPSAGRCETGDTSIGTAAGWVGSAGFDTAGVGFNAAAGIDSGMYLAAIERPHVWARCAPLQAAHEVALLSGNSGEHTRSSRLGASAHVDTSRAIVPASVISTNAASAMALFFAARSSRATTNLCLGASDSLAASP